MQVTRAAAPAAAPDRNRGRRTSEPPSEASRASVLHEMSIVRRLSMSTPKVSARAMRNGALKEKTKVASFASRTASGLAPNSPP